MSLLFGAIGAVFTLLVAFGGGAFGWWLRGTVERKPTQEMLTEDEKRIEKARERAMQQVLNYSADDAYGVNRDGRGERG